MAIDVKSFRRALGCFATGIAVVTVAGREGAPDVGITINSFTSVSLEPPLILFCLAQTSRHAPRFVAGRRFGVNLLGQDQGSLSIRFAGSATQDTWEGVDITRSEDGTPVLGGGLAHLVCRVDTVHVGGDHHIVVAEVEQFDWTKDGNPLLYFRGAYGKLGEFFVPTTSG